MKRHRTTFLIGAAAVYLAAVAFLGDGSRVPGTHTRAQAPVTPTPASTAFDQTAAIAKLREQIKGREQEPADKVFKNIQTPFIRSINAGRMLTVMEIAYSRSLGVTCTHCHAPEKWEADDKPPKQIAREMAAMMGRINSELLSGVKNLKSERPTINCTTCHRGEVKPALNLPSRQSE